MMDRLIEHTTKANALEGKAFLLAVSGGIDSMVLLHLFHTSGIRCHVAHVNYGFRNEESDYEESLVRTFCNENNIPFHHKKLEGYEALEVSGIHNLQAYAREQRYRYFRDLLEREGLEYIVTAHHADDNIETVLMNFIKGTGIRGLRGMEILKDNIFRPLLSVSRKDIASYALHHRLVYGEDSSNASNVYKRNFLRNAVIPGIEKEFPAFRNNVMNNITRLGGVYRIYRKYLEQRLQVVFTENGDMGRVDICKLEREQAADDLILEILEKYAFNYKQLDAFRKLMRAAQGAVLDNTAFKIMKDGGFLLITGIVSDTAFYHIEQGRPEGEGVYYSIDDATVGLQLVSTGDIDLTSGKPLYIDASRLTFPLLLRRAKAADYFYPLGLNKKKKVAKFLIDQKVPLAERAKVWVLLSGYHIIAVIGHRIDHRYRIGESSALALKIT